MGRFTADRWLGAGTGFSGVGVAGVVGYGIFVISGSHRSFWHWPGYISVVILGVGMVMLVVGFFAPGRGGAIHQSQCAGERSTNVQVGGDVRIGKDE
jgi:hypothetical protein